MRSTASSQTWRQPRAAAPLTPVDRQYAFSFSHHAPIEAAGRIIAAERLKEISRGRQVGLFSLVVAQSIVAASGLSINAVARFVQK